MTKQSKAGLAAIAAKSPDELRSLVREQITNPHAHPILHDDPTDERPEDIVVELLRVTDLPPERRASIVTVLREIAGDIFQFLQESDDREPSSRDETSTVVLDRWTSVMDRSAPEELKATCKSLLQLALDTDAIPSDWQNAIARAALRFRLNETDEDLWTQLLEHKTLAPLAYNALLKINPRDEKRVYQLFELWHKKLYDEWPINIEFLTALTSRKLGIETFVTSFSHLSPLDNQLYTQVLGCLQSSKITQLRDLFRKLVEKHFSRSIEYELFNTIIEKNLPPLIAEFREGRLGITDDPIQRKGVRKTTEPLHTPGGPSWKALYYMGHELHHYAIEALLKRIESSKDAAIEQKRRRTKFSAFVLYKNRNDAPSEFVPKISTPQQSLTRQIAKRDPILVNT